MKLSLGSVYACFAMSISGNTRKGRAPGQGKTTITMQPLLSLPGSILLNQGKTEILPDLPPTMPLIMLCICVCSECGHVIALECVKNLGLKGYSVLLIIEHSLFCLNAHHEIQT